MLIKKIVHIYFLYFLIVIVKTCDKPCIEFTSFCLFDTTNKIVLSFIDQKTCNKYRKL